MFVSIMNLNVYQMMNEIIFTIELIESTLWITNAHDIHKKPN
jgi:hypothetical protein